MEPIFKNDLPGEAQETLADISKAQSLGWSPRLDIESGLVKSIQYIKHEVLKEKK